MKHIQSVKENSYALILDGQRLFADFLALTFKNYNLFEHVFVFDMSENMTTFLINEIGRNEVYIFLDYHLKDKNGLTVLSEIRRLNKKARITFVTNTSSTRVINNIMLYKPDGIISKSSEINVLFECVKKVSQKQFYIDPYIEEIYEKTASEAPSFTPREIELLQYFAKGDTIAKTAEKTFLSKHTIVSHRRKMMAKLNVTNIGQLLAHAKKDGFI